MNCSSSAVDGNPSMINPADLTCNRANCTCMCIRMMVVYTDLYGSVSQNWAVYLSIVCSERASPCRRYALSSFSCSVSVSRTSSSSSSTHVQYDATMCIAQSFIQQHVLADLYMHISRFVIL